MRLISRNDASLAVTLIAAIVILFQHPLRRVFDLARDIETRYSVDLVPALILLVAVFIFHEYQKRQQTAAEALTAATDAAQARNRSEELERLMSFGQILANALDRPTLEQALWKYLPGLARDRGFWVVVRNRDHWEVLIQDISTRNRSVDDLEQLAERVLVGDRSLASILAGENVTDAEDACFPMFAGGNGVGVLGIRNAPLLSAAERNVLGAAAALIAISVKNMQLFLETRALSLRDGLTGCFNRAHALATLGMELNRSRRTGSALSILMFDIDDFKTINDQFGHLRGDELLAAVGGQLGSMLRTSDVRCRYGGDEFLVILPDTPVLGAQQVAEGVRQELANLTVAAGERAMTITISIGVAAAASGEIDSKALVDRADEALYRAKRAGRNRFCLAIPPSAATGLQPSFSVVTLGAKSANS